MSRRGQWILCLVVLALAAAPVVGAQEGVIAPGEERLKVNLGGVLFRGETTLRLDGSRLGVEVGLERALGLDPERSTLYAALAWRFAARHRVDLRTFTLTREAERAISETIELGNLVIPINTILRADSRLQFLIADYRYSFVKTSRVELAVALGILGGRYRFRFNATNPPVDIERSVDVPVPVFGASLDYFLTPRWTISGFAQGLKLDVNSETDARVYTLGASTEYMLTRHFGLGVALTRDIIGVELSRNDFRGHIGFRASSAIGYVQARF